MEVKSHAFLTSSGVMSASQPDNSVSEGGAPSSLWKEICVVFNLVAVRRENSLPLR